MHVIQKELQMTTIWTSYKPYIPEQQIDEFICPALAEERTNNLLTTQDCELKASNAGCKHLKICPQYQRHKKLETKYGDLNKLDETTKTHINLIIRGAIKE